MDPKVTSMFNLFEFETSIPVHCNVPKPLLELIRKILIKSTVCKIAHKILLQQHFSHKYSSPSTFNNFLPLHPETTKIQVIFSSMPSSEPQFKVIC